MMTCSDFHILRCVESFANNPPNPLMRQMFLSKETDYVLGETLALERKRGSEAGQQMSFDFAKGCRNTARFVLKN